ncbi:hypothetical protein ACIO1C_15225 [Streptomyces sp. NPDC087420]|uniref:hypothetical protein n=1 Tax=Streptomyces sp. NPDC087420 TaxID=3365785 RepID=UPI0038324BC5
MSGEPPVCFGFGSVRAAGDLSGTMIRTARVLGRRVIVSRGWAGLAPDVAARARDLAGAVRTDGARVAARHLVAVVSARMS